jgi:rhodanese-related sulfurtransferase
VTRETAGKHLSNAHHQAQLAELPADTEIVAYCRWPRRDRVHDAVRLLRGRGRSARRLAGGMPEWWLAGLPVPAGAAVQPART